jgi:hypothetical protein
VPQSAARQALPASAEPGRAVAPRRARTKSGRRFPYPQLLWISVWKTLAATLRHRQKKPFVSLWLKIVQPCYASVFSDLHYRS